MIRYVLLALFLLLCLGWSSGCGAPIVCEAGEKKLCKCLDIFGEKTCKADGTGYAVCRCGDEPVVEATIDQADAGQRDDKQDASEPVTADEPAAADEPTVADEPVPEPEPEPVVETIPEPVDCPTGEFSYKGKCYSNDDFCEGNLNEPGFPAFTAEDQKAMAQPYELEFDLISKKPIFCKTKDDYYYLAGAGYGLCDKDGDGWINIEAYRAVTSTDLQVQRNARCKLNKFTHIVYHAEGKKPQLQKLKSEAAMVETFRNDGGEKLIELPVYTKNQASLPKTISSACKVDNDCNTGTCYNGHCVTGRRFDPAEINTLTKGCIAGLDLNDNQLDDANESPSDTPTPAGEFGPLLSAGYFMELHHGHYQAGYMDNGTSLNVYNIHERSRSKATDQQGLPLKCQQKSDAFAPDLWKYCPLKDNQQCADPNDPTQLKKGLSHCWMKDVTRLIPSLFRCTVFENNSGNHFHPNQYGFDKHYTRPKCSFKGKLNANDPTKRDLEFDCSVDDGTRTPDPSKKEVGWACLSFQPYTDSADYLGSCVDQRAENICGDTKDGETVTYVKLETNSWGLARAKALCGNSNGKGQCGKAVRVCSGGTWDSCNNCNNCPQTTLGQKSVCPNGVWPSDSCSLELKASAEVCDGIDNNCDGSIDENLHNVDYLLDADKDGYGNNNKKLTVCTHVSGGRKFCRKSDQKCSNNSGLIDVSGTLTRYVKKTTTTDCNDANANIKPGATDGCDGINNDCDNQLDEGGTFKTYYKDDDGDGYGKQSTSFSACAKGTTEICRGVGDCTTLAYTKDGVNTEFIKTKSGIEFDCQDENKDVYPGQTSYFTAAYKDTSGNDSFDYNCDGTTSTKVTAPNNNGTNQEYTSPNICECLTTHKYKENKISTCKMECRSSETWDSDSSCKSQYCSYTGKDGNFACKIDKIHSFSATKDWGSHSCKKNCKVVGREEITFSCGQNNFTGTKASTFTPQATDGASLFAIPKSSFTNTKTRCYFLKTGNKPSCGDQPFYIDTSKKESTPTYTKEDENICSKSSSKCSGGSTWRSSCIYTHTVNYQTTNYYFKETSLAQAASQISCR